MPFEDRSPILLFSAACLAATAASAILDRGTSMRRIAGLPGVAKACLGAFLDGIFEIGIIQDDVGGLAAEFLSDTLHSGSGSQGHCDPRSRGPREGDQRPRQDAKKSPSLL